MTSTREQIKHDKINLRLIVKNLKKSVDEWKNLSTSSDDLKWLKAQGVLQGIKYSRRLLQNIEIHNDDLLSPRENARPKEPLQNDVEQTLDRIEGFMTESSKELKLQPRLRPAILPTVPIPESLRQDSVRSSLTGQASGAETPEVTLLPAEEMGSQHLLPTHDFNLGSSGPTPSAAVPIPNSAMSLIPPSIPSPLMPSDVTSTAIPTVLQTSSALQTDLADQLAQMAQQLKLNALHFSEALAKDQGVVAETQEKIEENYDGLKKERLRLRDHRGKSTGTTWLVMLSMTIVVVMFFLMFLVIRIS